MHTCIKQLLEEVGSPKPEDVECMCKLLATVGGILDASTKQVKNFNNGKPASTKEVMNVYFGRIETLSRNEALDSRHRFMLLDLIDQRRNRWRPRKEVGGWMGGWFCGRGGALGRSGMFVGGVRSACGASAQLQRRALQQKVRKVLHAAWPTRACALTAARPPFAGGGPQDD
jgi:hypothetical protein